MDPAQLMAWMALFGAAAELGKEVYDGVRSLAGGSLTPDELKEVEAQWEANADRSAKNAGIDPAA